MNRLLPILTICVAGCTPAVEPTILTDVGTDGYDLHLSKTFKTSDGQWAWKWRTLEGGIENFRQGWTSESGLYALTHVTGTDPNGNPVSYVCAAFLSAPLKAGPCEAQHGVEAFAPLEVINVEQQTTQSGGTAITVEIALVPTSWLKFERRVIGIAKYEHAS